MAIEEKRYVTITLVPRRHPNREVEHQVIPFKVYISTQTGRQYLFTFDKKYSEFSFFRIDGIHSVNLGEVCGDYDKLSEECDEYRKYTWGTSSSKNAHIEHFEMVVHASENEGFIVDRLKREKRTGSVEQVGEWSWKYTVDCYDASEMIPWIRTFIGRIESISCSNKRVEKVFAADLNTLYEMYGGDDNAV